MARRKVRMADTEDIAKVLTDYVVDDPINMYIPSIQDKIHDIVCCLMPDVQMKDVRSFVRRMKASEQEEGE
jgi:hypothetical protein